MKQQHVVLISFLVSLGLCGCGGRSIEAEEALPDGGGAGKDGGGGTGGSGGAAGGTGGEAGGSGGQAGTGTGGGTAGAAGMAGAAGAGGSLCALTTGNPGCDDCMNVSCATDCDACGSNPDCAAFVSCALSCTTGDAACMQDCVAQHDAGVSDGLPLVGPAGCLRDSCNSACIASGVSCSISLGSSACDQCVVGYCMAECTACADNPSCVDLVACAGACAPDDQGCLLQCGIQNPGGIGEANAFAGDAGCVRENCSVECGGAPSTCAIEYGVPACDSCVASQCLAPCNACAANPDCVALVQCAFACAPDDQGCVTGCAMQNPMGIADATSFAGDTGCVPQKCPAECGSGAATCTVQSGNAACDACLATECAGSCSTCSENPDCEALAACYFACAGDIQCQIGCASDHPGGLQDAGALIGPTGCVAADCSFWCP